MPHCSRILALVFGLGLVWLLSGSAAADKDDAERIDKLIEQLGSGSFKEREAATKALGALGAPALEKLRKAADSDDAEVKRRAADLVTRIEKRAEVGRVLTAKRVRLAYKDTPLKEALEDFKKKSGYDLSLHDPDNKLAARKVTLDTGDVIFWEAFDQFCAAAGIQQLTQQDLMQQRMQEMMMRPQERMNQLKNVAPPALPAGKKPEVKEAPARPAPEKDERPAAPPKPEGTKKADEKRAAAAARERAVQVEAARAELEVAMALAQLQVAQPAPGGRPAMMIAPGMRGMPSMSPDQIVLTDGKRKALPTQYVGSVRIRALEPATNGVGQETPLLVNLQVDAEPKYQVQRTATPRVTKAVDDNGQSLSQMEAGDNGDEPVVGPGGARRLIFRGGPGGFSMPSMMGGPGAVAIPLKKGEKPSTMLKELTGALTLQMLDAPEALITVENVLKAGGTTVKGKAGGQIKIIDATKSEDGQIKMQVELALPPEVIPAGRQGFAGGMMATPVIRFNAFLPAPLPVAQPAVVPPAEPIKEKPSDKPKQAPAKEAKTPAKEQVKDKPVAAQPPPPPVAVPAIAIAPAFGGGPGAFGGGARYPGNVFNGLKLVDEKGKSFPITRVSANSRVAAAGAIETTYELTFETKKGQDQPAKLIFSGSRTVTVEVPFTLKDVPLK